MSDRFEHHRERRLDSRPHEADDVAVRAPALITGVMREAPADMRRRRWSSDDKARILFESFMPGASVSEVARRHGVSPPQLSGWRRELRASIAESADEGAGRSVETASGTARTCGGGRADGDGKPAFTRVVIAAPALTPSLASPPPTGTSPGAIEITIGDAVVRVSGQVDVAVLVSALRAVRRAS